MRGEGGEEGGVGGSSPGTAYPPTRHNRRRFPVLGTHTYGSGGGPLEALPSGGGTVPATVYKGAF
jgi:hypothetical protein